MLPANKAIDYTDVMIAQDLADASDIVETSGQLLQGRVIPENLMALRMQHPYLEIEPMPQHSVVGNLTAGQKHRVEVPAGAKIITVISSSNFIVSLGGAVSEVASGAVVESSGSFVLPNGMRRFGVNSGTVSIDIVCLADGYFSIDFYSQAG